MKIFSSNSVDKLLTTINIKLKLEIKFRDKKEI